MCNRFAKDGRTVAYRRALHWELKRWLVRVGAPLGAQSGIPSMRAARPRETTVPAGELAAVLRACSQRLRLALILARDAALRRSAIERFTIRNCDFDRQEVVGVSKGWSTYRVPMTARLLDTLTAVTLLQTISKNAKGEQEPMTDLQIIKHQVSDAMEQYPPAPLASTELTVKRCLLAMAAEADRCNAEGVKASERRKRCQIAFKLYMPALTDRPAIKAHIACIAHGIALKVFDGRDASQMLYAAQVAVSLVKQEEAEKKKAGPVRRGGANKARRERAA